MKILNFGSLNRDLVYTGDHAVRPGETISSGSMEPFCGGKGLNQSLALARAGAEVYHAGCIGSDGSDLLRLLQDSGVDTRYIRRVDGPSGHAIIQVDGRGQNSILLFGGANRRIPPEAVEDALRDFGEGDWLVLQNEINGIPRIMERAHDRGMRIILNPSPFDGDIAAYPLEKVSWFVLNEIEGEALTGEGEPTAILRAAAKRFPGAKILLTLGKRGAMAAEGAAVYTHPIFPTPVRDTTAAGDTFLGYFFALLEELGPQEALRWASAASALAVSVKGAANSIPRRREVADFLAQPLC